jgi:hypothetical protein
VKLTHFMQYRFSRLPFDFIYHFVDLIRPILIVFETKIQLPFVKVQSGSV